MPFGGFWGDLGSFWELLRPVFDLGRAKLSGASSGSRGAWASFQGGLTRTWGEKDVWVLRGFVFMAWGERSSLALPFGEGT